MLANTLWVNGHEQRDHPVLPARELPWANSTIAELAKGLLTAQRSSEYKN